MSNIYNVYLTTTRDMKERIIPEITFSLARYKIRGAAVMSEWSDRTGAIIMKPFEFSAEGIDSEDAFIEIIKSFLNDNGFGCRDIKGAYVEIYGVYEAKENEHYIHAESEIYIKEMFVDKDPYKLTEEETALAYDAFNYGSC
jgi:hypothetical protein